MSSLRLAFVQALAKAPAGQLESHSRIWVPLLLAFSSAKASGESAAAGEQQQDGGAVAAAAAAAASSDADSDADEGCAEAAVAADAVEGADAEAGAAAGSGGLASHVGGRAWRAHLKVSTFCDEIQVKPNNLLSTLLPSNVHKMSPNPWRALHLKCVRGCYHFRTLWEAHRFLRVISPLMHAPLVRLTNCSYTPGAAAAARCRNCRQAVAPLRMAALQAGAGHLIARLVMSAGHTLQEWPAVVGDLKGGEGCRAGWRSAV